MILSDGLLKGHDVNHSIDTLNIFMCVVALGKGNFSAFSLMSFFDFISVLHLLVNLSEIERFLLLMLFTIIIESITLSIESVTLAIKFITLAVALVRKFIMSASFLQGESFLPWGVILKDY